MPAGVLLLAQLVGGGSAANGAHGLIPVRQAADTAVRLGAQVRVQAAALGPGWHRGKLTSSVGAGACLAVALTVPDAQGRQRLVYLTGVAALEVDRRTNEGVATFGLGEPADSDWVAIPAERLAAQDAGCSRRAGQKKP